MTYNAYTMSIESRGEAKEPPRTTWAEQQKEAGIADNRVRDQFGDLFHRADVGDRDSGKAIKSLVERTQEAHADQRSGRDTALARFFPYADDEEWKDDAACKDKPEKFDRVLDSSGYRKREAVSEAQAVCKTCGVRTACLGHTVNELDRATKKGQTQGVWAGIETSRMENIMKSKDEKSKDNKSA
jgi:hypothetical protein